MKTFGLSAPDTRNPFAGKGLAVTTALLVGGDRPWTLAELAQSAEVSRPLVTKVIRALGELVAGDVVQGREASVRARPALFDEAAPHWPAPVASVQGGSRPDGLVVGGGSLAGAELGVPWEAPPRVYVRTLDEARRLLARAGGAVVSEAVAEWEIAVAHYPFAPGAVPPIVLALELARTPRGREVVADERIRRRLFDGWPA